MAYPNIGQQFILDTDASNYGIGAVLSQLQDGHERVIAYASRTLNRAEQNYCVTRREMLEIVNFLKHFRHYLYGQEILVRTDHGALRRMLNIKNPERNRRVPSHYVELKKKLYIYTHVYPFSVLFSPTKMPLHDCNHCKSAFSSVTELHSHLEEIHHISLTWKCELCSYESPIIANLNKHYTRSEGRTAKEVRSCRLSEAGSSYQRKIIRNQRKRGHPDPDPPKINQSPPPISIPLPKLPKIPKLKISNPESKINDDQISLHTTCSLSDDESIPSPRSRSPTPVKFVRRNGS